MSQAGKGKGLAKGKGAKGVKGKSKSGKKQHPGLQPLKGVGKRTSLPRKAKPVRISINPVLACHVAKLIKGRKDTSLLTQHLLDIAAHAMKYEARIQAGKAQKAKGDASLVHALPSWQAKVTEAKGERETTLAMISPAVSSGAWWDRLVEAGLLRGDRHRPNLVCTFA